MDGMFNSNIRDPVITPETPPPRLYLVTRTVWQGRFCWIFGEPALMRANKSRNTGSDRKPAEHNWHMWTTRTPCYESLTQTNPDNLPLAPPSVRVDRLPELLQDGDEALTVDEARETYLRIERASWNSDERTSKHLRHLKNLYPRILEADRQFQQQYEELTTAKLTRGLTPFDESGEWLTLWELDEMLNGGEVRRRVMEAIRYHLSVKRDFDYEWVAVTSVTLRSGAPREYIYLWIDDPDNEVEADWLAPALQKHLDRCENAFEDDHAYNENGSAGAITVRYSPPLISASKETFWKIQDASEAPSYPNTTGANFVAKQLVHLPVGDYYNSKRKNPSDTLIEGAALAWASPYRWFRASRGVPNP